MKTPAHRSGRRKPCTPARLSTTRSSRSPQAPSLITDPGLALGCAGVHPSQEPGWLEGTLNGKTGLIPENYVEFL
ncbi:PREDICTED: rho GTPase-activating protein 26-like [Miniopterus natalensis]|uniref:rho GTPase-activating protein 26-like n=1 Tax=Miniopterus natalensis TaxID=291302 RepID=UPI0007A7115A|nr:PREDICTED: rho GTPase-activating protein 26-like [Miniopterus natalensis]